VALSVIDNDICVTGVALSEEEDEEEETATDAAAVADEAEA
jgi:hypothetical protein